MTRSGLAAAALLTTAAAWLSQGTLAVSSLDGSRIGTPSGFGVRVGHCARRWRRGRRLRARWCVARADVAPGVHRLSVVAVARAGGVPHLERSYPMADLDGGRRRDARHSVRGPRPSPAFAQASAGRSARARASLRCRAGADRPRSMAGALAFVIFACRRVASVALRARRR